MLIPNPLTVDNNVEMLGSPAVAIVRREPLERRQVDLALVEHLQQLADGEAALRIARHSPLTWRSSTEMCVNVCAA